MCEYRHEGFKNQQEMNGFLEDNFDFLKDDYLKTGNNPFG